MRKRREIERDPNFFEGQKFRRQCAETFTVKILTVF